MTGGCWLKERRKWRRNAWQKKKWLKENVLASCAIIFWLIVEYLNSVWFLKFPWFIGFIFSFILSLVFSWSSSRDLLLLFMSLPPLPVSPSSLFWSFFPFFFTNFKPYFLHPSLQYIHQLLLSLGALTPDFPLSNMGHWPRAHWGRGGPLVTGFPLGTWGPTRDLKGPTGNWESTGVVSTKR